MLGRNSFRGPAYYDFDFAVIKPAPIVNRSSGLERADLQFRGDFFNVFNVVNMSLPPNTIEGTGFGAIGKTAGDLSANSVCPEAHLLRDGDNEGRTPPIRSLSSAGNLRASNSITRSISNGNRPRG